MERAPDNMESTVSPVGAAIGFWMFLKLVSLLGAAVAVIYALYCLSRIAGQLERLADLKERESVSGSRPAAPPAAAPPIPGAIPPVNLPSMSPVPTPSPAPPVAPPPPPPPPPPPVPRTTMPGAPPPVENIERPSDNV